MALTDKKRAFYNSVGTDIMSALKTRKVLKDRSYIVVAQRLHENGWGAAVPGNNLFNVKGTGPAGSFVNPNASEEVNGVLVPTNDPFRKYHTLLECLDDYLAVLKSNWPESYRALYDKEKSIDDFITGLDHGTRGKYATQTGYGELLKTLYLQVKREFKELGKENS